MNRSEIALLERAFAAEIDGALGGGLGIIQSRSKVARSLVADGLLEERSARVGTGAFAAKVSGLGLTHLGRFTYCSYAESTPAASGLSPEALGQMDKERA